MKIYMEQLRRRCLMDGDEFKKEGNYTDFKDGLGMVYKDNGPDVKVLGVAHIDTVPNHVHCQSVTLGKKETIVYSPQLDDRLGAYIMLDLLPSIGVKIDVLLTDGEESGRSTGGRFIPEKEYNWMFMFDRRGADVVMYCYDNKEMQDLMRAHGFKPERGSFSCIARMESLKCKGFNFGCGYRGEHTENCYAKLSETYRQVQLFSAFWRSMKDTRLPHTSFSSQGHSNSFHSRRDEHTYGRTWSGGNCGTEKEVPPPVSSCTLDWMTERYDVVRINKGEGNVHKRGCSNNSCHNLNCTDPCSKLKVAGVR